jgi:hypothetical protein
MTPPFYLVPIGLVIGIILAMPVCVIFNIPPGPSTVIGMVTGAIGVLLAIMWWERRQERKT